MNLFSYCQNNPIMYVDENGNFVFSLLLALAGVVVVGTINGLVSMAGKGEKESAGGAFLAGFIDGTIGAVSLAAGVATGGIGGFAIAAIGGFAGGVIGNAVGQTISYGNVHWGAAALQGVMSAMINVTSFVGGNLIGIGTTAISWGKKFMEALKLATLSIGVSAYLASLPTFNFNKIRSDFY